jgi:hypothetical protein
MFKVLDRSILMSEIENSFKYAKVYKNKMTFEDFKEYFHSFWRCLGGIGVEVGRLEDLTMND